MCLQHLTRRPGFTRSKRWMNVGGHGLHDRRELDFKEANEMDGCRLSHPVSRASGSDREGWRGEVSTSNFTDKTEGGQAC